MSFASRRGAVVASWATALLLVAARPAAGSGAASLFPNEADLFVERPGLVRLVLPAEILAQCHPDLADLRIFDRTGHEVPFFVDADRGIGSPLTQTRTIPAQILDVHREVKRPPEGPARVREEYEIEFPEEGTALQAGTSAPTRRELWVRSAQPHFVRSVRVSQRLPDGSVTILAQDTGIFRIEGAERSHIPLLAQPRHLSFVIEGFEDFYLEPSFYLQSTDAVAQSRTTVPLAMDSLRSEAGQTAIELPRAPGLQPEVLRVETTSSSFVRHVSVWDLRQGHADRRLGEAEILRIPAPGVVEQVDVPVEAAVGERLRIEIADRDSPPLENVTLQAMVRPVGLVFSLSPALDGAPDAVLRFGGGRTTSPSYDLANLNRANGRAVELDRILTSLREESAVSQAAVRLGPVRPNPVFDPSPALSFAMQPGSEVDSRQYRRRRPVDVNPSSEGLSLLGLDAEEIAATRADFADVRVIDSAHRQWPYLLEPAAHKEWVELLATANNRSDHTSRIRFEFPVAPLLVDRVEIDPDSAFFNRPYRLRTIGREGGDRILAAGRLVRSAGQSEPAEIDFPPERLEGIELSVEDGDDAPLVFRSARAQVLLPQLFLVAPTGSYMLLVGDPDAEMPRYQVAQVRDVVLAVASTPARVGPGEPNPDYRAHAGLASGERGARLARGVLLWTTLLGGVAVLSLLTLRAVRREGQPKDLSDDRPRPD